MTAIRWRPRGKWHDYVVADKPVPAGVEHGSRCGQVRWFGDGPPESYSISFSDTEPTTCGACLSFRLSARLAADLPGAYARTADRVEEMRRSIDELTGAIGQLTHEGPVFRVGPTRADRQRPVVLEGCEWLVVGVYAEQATAEAIAQHLTAHWREWYVEREREMSSPP